MSHTALLLAVAAHVDPRSARKALKYGAASVRGRAGERIAEAAARHGIILPEHEATQSAGAH